MDSVGLGVKCQSKWQCICLAKVLGLHLSSFLLTSMPIGSLSSSARAAASVSPLSRLISSKSYSLSSRPFNQTSLSHIRQLLQKHQDAVQQLELKSVGGQPISNKPLGSAAVLIPLCNIDDKPGILLEVRAKELRSHSGELRFVHHYDLGAASFD